MTRPLGSTRLTRRVAPARTDTNAVNLAGLAASLGEMRTIYRNPSIIDVDSPMRGAAAAAVKDAVKNALGAIREPVTGSQTRVVSAAT